MINLKDSWNYLDVLDKNLLYEYAQVLSGQKKQMRMQMRIKASDIITEYEQMKQAEKKKKTAYYLIWFVYRYVLNCETLEEALNYANKETLIKFHLNSYIINANIYIGNGIDKELCFRKSEDIEMILEIVYNRYNFFEQLDCFTRHTTKLRKQRCLEVTQKYNSIYELYMQEREKNETA